MNYDYILLDTSSLFHRFYYRDQKQEAVIDNEGYAKRPDKEPHWATPKNGGNFYASTLITYFQYLSHLRKKYPEAKFIHAIDSLDQSQSFRKGLDPDYKSNRGPKEPWLLKQLKVLPNILQALGEVQLQKPNYEADDIIESIVVQASAYQENGKWFPKENPPTFLIVSRDKDLLQAKLGDHVHVDTTNKVNGQNEILKTNEDVYNKRGVMPYQLTGLLALLGDDGISGFKGVGEKTALTAINHFGNIFNMLEGLKEDAPQKELEKMYKLLRKTFSDPENVQKLFNNYRIVVARNDLELPYPLEDLHLEARKAMNSQTYNDVKNFLHIGDNFIKSFKPLARPTHANENRADVNHNVQHNEQNNTSHYKTRSPIKMGNPVQGASAQPMNNHSVQSSQGMDNNGVDQGMPPSLPPEYYEQAYADENGSTYDGEYGEKAQKATRKYHTSTVPKSYNSAYHSMYKKP